MAIWIKFADDHCQDCDESAASRTHSAAQWQLGGLLSITMPDGLGCSNFDVTEPAIMMHAVASSGGGQAVASTIHINPSGPPAIVVHGSVE